MALLPFLALLPTLATGLAGSDAHAGEAETLRPEAKRVVFRDATAEDPAGPDITTVTVSNDDRGLITFRVAIPSRPKLTEGMRFRIWIDSDGDRATGLSVNGMDFFLLHDRGRTGLWRCRASSCTGPSSSARTLRFRYSSEPSFTISNAEIGDTRRFRFAVEAATGIVVDPVTKTVDTANAHFDDAPQRGRSWTYATRFRASA
jgi:hypothetical protein